MNFANVGIPVKILEMNDEALEKALELSRKIMMRLPGKAASVKLKWKNGWPC